MKNYLFRSNNINKSYNNHKILNNLSLNIEEGDIYGFVGKNGAGKTSMLRIILGLIYPDSGEIELLGNTDIEKINLSRAKIGSLIERPIFYGNMTARENLQLIKIQKNLENTIDLNKILKLVNLHNVKNKSKDFSLGMKQRLGIAMAILNNPELLILDEPINGLDPIGIKEIRELLLNLNNKYGTTILISSHILSELTQLATKYGFINQGHLIKEISSKELHLECRNYLHLKVNSISNIGKIIEEQFNTPNYEIFPDNTVNIYDKIKIENLSLILSKYSIAIYELFQNEESLEDYFSRLIKGDNNE
ncbi:ATP-binding cassette domain-containing protein [Clostridium sp. BJN0013]|uniref:ATP-binding cassette domain-containing protein n=1 Tax=Clostridium sp. BJN0013 TaxID=3236840 RepID=UPI0034C5C9CE